MGNCNAMGINTIPMLDSGEIYDAFAFAVFKVITQVLINFISMLPNSNKNNVFFVCQVLY